MNFKPPSTIHSLFIQWYGREISTVKFGLENLLGLGATKRKTMHKNQITKGKIQLRIIRASFVLF